MDDDRQAKRISKWDEQQNGPWITDMYDMCCKYGFEDQFFQLEKLDFVYLTEKTFTKLNMTVRNESEVAGHCEFKYDYFTENDLFIMCGRKKEHVCAPIGAGRRKYNLSSE